MKYQTGGMIDAGIAIIMGLLIGLGAAALVNPSSPPANAQQTAAFDHSNCQYPDRWSNPPNGCDNSDPAVPECIKEFSTKEGEAACQAAFVASHEPAPVETVTPAPAKAECEGK